VSRATLPHHPDAEKAIIGELVVFYDCIEEAQHLLEPGDFYDRTCGQAFELLVDYWKDGMPLTPAALVDKLRDVRRAVTSTWMAEVIALGAGGGWRIHADTVLGDHERRQLLFAAEQIVAGARALDEDPGLVLEQAKARLDRIDGPAAKGFDAKPIEWYLDQNPNEHRRWVVEGLLRNQWRVIVVASEGGGKTTLLRQFAMLASQGVHPLHYMPIDHVKVLYVDIENDPFGEGHYQFARMRKQFGADYLPGQLRYITARRGINLLDRLDRRKLEASIIEFGPDMLLIGPVYRMHRRAPGQTDEDSAGIVQEVLDDLRVRYDLAVMLEHHAPKGATSGSREMLPFGTSLWLRWPELGIGLERIDKNDRKRMTVKHWREAREENQWPEEIHWGETYPWQGKWPDDGWKQRMW
jgi:replicative DNA helicase